MAARNVRGNADQIVERRSGFSLRSQHRYYQSAYPGLAGTRTASPAPDLAPMATLGGMRGGAELEVRGECTEHA
jgi:hypothetical protein